MMSTVYSLAMDLCCVKINFSCYQLVYETGFELLAFMSKTEWYFLGITIEPMPSGVRRGKVYF